MKCPNKKCKGRKSLNVTRTYNHDDKVIRDRRCPKCKQYVRSIEILESSMACIKQTYENENYQLKYDKNELQEELDDLQGALRIVIAAAKPISSE